jgi:hypothetical protein
MNLTADYLYGLLPAVYRERDGALGVAGGPGPLRELIEIVAGQLALIDAEIDQLYDDAFIETCAAWVVPYIGDLVGYTPLNVNANLSLSPRAEVADTIRYRRWKGTVTILEQLASDVTGWSALAVEFFTRLAATQFVNHLRMQSLGVADIRHHAAASTAGGPFDANPHAVEVRRIRSKRGRFNIPNVGVYVWRLGTFANFDNPSDAFRIGEGLYVFDPLGADRSLVNVPVTKKDQFTRTKPSDVPAALNTRVVAEEGPPYVFHVYDTTGALIPDSKVAICDLSGWTTAAGAPNLSPPFQVAVDPRLGRIWFPAGVVPAARPILVTYGYAFSGGYGAGFYHRNLTSSPNLSVLRDAGTLEPNLTITGAVNTALGASASAIVEYADNVTDASPSTVVPVSSGQTVVVRAADWRRPTFLGPVTVDASVVQGQTATFVLDGFVLGAGVVISGTGALTLVLRKLHGSTGRRRLGRRLVGGERRGHARTHSVSRDCGPGCGCRRLRRGFDCGQWRRRCDRRGQSDDPAVDGVRFCVREGNQPDRECDRHGGRRQPASAKRLRSLFLSAVRLNFAAALPLPAGRRRSGRDRRRGNRRSHADRGAIEGHRRPRRRAGCAAVRRRRLRRSGLRAAFRVDSPGNRRRR